MKHLIVLSAFLFLTSERPDVTKIYIAESGIAPDTYEVIKFDGKDSLLSVIFGKHPDDHEDFFGETNLKRIKDHMNKNPNKEEKEHYILKGDSIFLDRSDAILTIKIHGILKDNGFILNRTMIITNDMTNKQEIVKTINNQIFKPY